MDSSTNKINNQDIQRESLDFVDVLSHNMKNDSDNKSHYNVFEKWVKTNANKLGDDYGVYLNYDEIYRAYQTIFVRDKNNYFYDELTGKFTLLQTEKQLKTVLETKYKLVDTTALFDEIADADQRKGIIKALYGFIKGDFMNMLCITNSVANLKVSINPFLKEPKVKRNMNNLNLTQNKIYFNSYESLTENISIDEKLIYIKDFHNHFKKFMDILDWIIDCRFAKNRRKSYLYLRMNAGFGKTFFMHLLKEIGIAISVKYSELIKNPSGLNPMEFLNSITMFIDEFKTFGAELKEVTNYITVTSKNQLRAEVEVYSKIFMSAEKSSSFFGGVDPQIIDRISKIDIDSLKLDDRELYQQNPTNYYAVVKEYCWKYLTIRLNEYLQKTELEATMIADKRILEFYDNNGLKADSLDEVIRSLFYDTINDILEWKEDIKKSSSYRSFEVEKKELSKVVKEQLAPLVFKRKKGDIFIDNYEKFFSILIKEQTESFYKKAQYKATQVAEILKASNVDSKTGKTKSVKVNGATQRHGILIELDKIAPVKAGEVEEIIEDSIEIDIKNKDGEHIQTIYQEEGTGKLIDKNGKEAF